MIDGDLTAVIDVMKKLDAHGNQHAPVMKNRVLAHRA